MTDAEIRAVQQVAGNPARRLIVALAAVHAARPAAIRRHGVDLDRIRGDRILHEALTAGPDPLHLALVFNLSHTTASRYAAIAQHLLDDQLEQPPSGSQPSTMLQEPTEIPSSTAEEAVGSR